MTSFELKAPLSDTSGQSQDTDEKLDCAHPKPQSQGATQVSEEGGEREVRDEGLSDGHFRIKRNFND